MKTRASLALCLLWFAVALPSAPTRAYTPAGVDPVVIAVQPFNIATPGAMRFVFTVDADVAPDDSSIVEVQVHRRVGNREAFRSIASGAAEVRVLDTFTTTIGALTRDDQGRFVLSTAALFTGQSTNTLTFGLDGVYPITVRVRDPGSGGVTASVMTFVHKHSEQVVDPVPVSTLVRLSPPPSITVDGSIVITEDTRQKVRDFTAFLATYAAPLTIGVQPEIIASLAASAEPGDAQLLANLREQLRRFSIATSTFVAADASMFAAGALDDEFLEQLRLGEATLSRHLPEVSVQRDTWIADAPVTPAAVALLRKAGVTSVILTPNAQADTTTAQPRAVVHRVEGRPADYVALSHVDAGVSDVLARTGQFGGPTLAGHRAAAEAIMAATDLKAAGRPNDSVRIIVSSPNGEITPGGALSTTARGLIGGGIVTATDMSKPATVTSSTPVLSLRAEAPLDAADRARGIAAMRLVMDATASMTAETDVRRDTWAHLLAVAESTVVAEPQVYLDALTAVLKSTRDAVTINTPGTITLSGRNSNIRLQIRNNSTSPLTVQVRLSSPKLSLDEPDRTVSLSPESTTELEVPAEALSNGRFPIDVTVTTPTGGLDVVPRTTITARVNALAGYGQLVSISLLLVLAAWWWSHWRKGKLEAAQATTVSA